MEYYGMSDRGKVRAENQDIFAACDLEYLKLFCVCDGMGGMAGGRIASETALTEFIRCFKELCNNFVSSDNIDSLSIVLSVFLKKSVSAACDKILKLESQCRDYQGMGTTLVACALFDSTAYCVNIGDSRLYRFSLAERVLEQVTKDHSLNAALLEIGDPDAISGKGKNLLTRSLGSNRNTNPDAFILPLDDDDILLLCSDGLYNALNDGLSDILDQCSSMSAENICNQLIQKSLEGDASDNITAIVIKK